MSPHGVSTLAPSQSPHETSVVREHSWAVFGMFHGHVHTCYVTGNYYRHVSTGGHVLWRETGVHVNEAGRQFPRAQLPEVRHGEMLGRSMT